MSIAESARPPVQTIQCEFWCKTCMGGWRRFAVRQRKPGEHIVVYIEAVQSAMGLAHTTLSPLCPAREADLKVPAKMDGTVGMK